MGASARSALLFAAGLSLVTLLGCEEESSNSSNPEQTTVRAIHPTNSDTVNYKNIPFIWELNAQKGMTYNVEIRTDKGSNACDDNFEEVIYRETVTATNNTTIPGQVNRTIRHWSDSFCWAVHVTDSNGKTYCDGEGFTITY